MSVAPDLLLKSAPEVKPRAAASKPQEKPAQPNKNEASSFSQVYAKERQAKAAERNDGPAKPARESNVEKDEPQDAQVQAAVGQTEVADSGKPLPTDPASDGAALDPLLLLGITGEMPVAETDDVALEAEPVPLMVTTGNLTSSGPASMTEASFDAELGCAQSAAGSAHGPGNGGEGEAAGRSGWSTLGSGAKRQSKLVGQSGGAG